MRHFGSLMRVLVLLPVILAAPCLPRVCQAAISWHYNPDTGREYALAADEVTWAEAEALALGFGGHLATIHGDNENTWLKDRFLSGPVIAAWVGLSDIDAEGSWAWASGEPVDYANWADGEPNDWPPGEDVVAMLATGKWNDSQEALLKPGIMERPAPVIPEPAGLGLVAFALLAARKKRR